ncbi:hypothetical protein DNK59_11305 [Pseudomonas sp. TKO26]|nr:hypothetical protein DNK62_11305 [Pseudomonas sp. TKO30]PYY89973.1 hypothetical protein DNK61_11300 [Pseudomonas sp. TKO29]PYY93061.1 hypothetical protein DNK59_11305 [Pseudomonas sp. TKO26]PYZ00191.1 hypothetical protein DNK60_11300 [Pseudomonas sp. TKO14]
MSGKHRSISVWTCSSNSAFCLRFSTWTFANLPSWPASLRLPCNRVTPSGARIGELVATKLFPNKSVDQLTEAERQQISALSTLAGGLLGCLAGGDLANAVAGGETAKNAAENNAMGMDVGTNLALWLSNNKECDIECKGKIAQQGAGGGLVLSAAMLVALTATAATPEVIALARASMAGCKANPVLCVNEVNIWLAEFVASEALPAGLVAGGAAKLTAEQLSDVRALMELQKQTGKQVSSEALSVALGKTTGKPDAPTLAGKGGSIDGLSTSEKTLGGAGGNWKVIDEVVDPSVVKQVNSLSCGQACVAMMLGDRKINASQSVISELVGDGETYET